MYTTQKAVRAAFWAYYQCGHDTGDAIRNAARAEFGRGIASRWFS